MQGEAPRYPNRPTWPLRGGMPAAGWRSCSISNQARRSGSHTRWADAARLSGDTVIEKCPIDLKGIFH
jgi:hypothetical protein